MVMEVNVRERGRQTVEGMRKQTAPIFAAQDK